VIKVKKKTIKINGTKKHKPDNQNSIKRNKFKNKHFRQLKTLQKPGMRSIAAKSKLLLL
jgi:hypothetical protein